MPKPEVTKKTITVRVRAPKLFIHKTFKTISISERRGIQAVIDRLMTEPEGAAKTQSFVFDKKKWTVSAAIKWSVEHKKMTDILLGNDKEVIDFSGKEEIKTMKKVKKIINCVIKNFDVEKRTFDAIASTEVVDRDGDILRTSGWKLKNYKKNNIGLWQHNTSLPPIFKTIKIEKSDKQLTFTPQFAPKEVYPFADQVFELYRLGFLKAFSVRFDPDRWEVIEPPENMERGHRVRFGRDFKSMDLLEISAVNVPSNVEALASKEYQNFILKSNELNNLDMIEDPQIKTSLLGTSKTIKDVKTNTDNDSTNENEIDCQVCSETFTYRKDLEEKEGSMKCPHCQTLVDNKGEEVKQDPPEDDTEKQGAEFSAKNKKFLKTLADQLGGAAKTLSAFITQMDEKRSADDMIDGVKNDIDNDTDLNGEKEEKEKQENLEELERITAENETTLSSLNK
ncbi:hypothetical protein LCGC14_0764670 [marine sediment metagenome]|uniref:Uncharacterized protein n=1 Tax=marine sediment metagenome TaxID=412755 RepID=A0A0F9Q4B7_9ZZZZ